jgi:O-antigen ligase
MRLSRSVASSVATFCVIFIGSIDLEQFGASPSVNLLAKALFAFIAITLAALFFSSDGRIPFLHLGVTSAIIILFGVVCGFSVGWSIDRVETVVAIMSWLVTFSAAYLLVGLDLAKLSRALVGPFGFICLLSLIYALASPNAFAVTEGLLRLRGVVYGPHGLAEPSAVCLCILLSGVTGFQRRAKWALFIIVGVCLYLTYSRQAYAAAFIGVALAIYIRAKGNARIGYLFAGVAVGCVALIVLLSSADLTSLISRGNGDDVGTLTGRTLIWAAAMRLIQARPFLGYGFGAGGQAIEVGYSGGVSGWTTQSAHNALLQVGLDLGIVGIILLIICIVIFVINALKLKRQFSVPLVGAVLVVSLVERGLYETGGFVPLVFLLILISGENLKTINGPSENV